MICDKYVHIDEEDGRKALKQEKRKREWRKAKQ